jgi:hypothetical protein
VLALSDLRVPMATIHFFDQRIAPSSMDVIVLFGLAAAAVTAVGAMTILVIAIVAGVMRRWHR